MNRSDFQLCLTINEADEELSAGSGIAVGLVQIDDKTVNSGRVVVEVEDASLEVEIGVTVRVDERVDVDSQ